MHISALHIHHSAYWLEAIKVKTMSHWSWHWWSHQICILQEQVTKPNRCCASCFFMLTQNCFCTSENLSVSGLRTYIPAYTSLLCQVSWWFVRTDLSLPVLYYHEHFLQSTHFPWIHYLLQINSWMMTLQQASIHKFIGILDCRYLQVNLWMHFLKVPLLKTHLNTKTCVAD